MKGFDSVAKIYDRLSRLVFGDAMKLAQTHFLRQLPDSGRVLIIGGGTGWILEEVLALRTNLSVDYIDASSDMISLTRRRLNNENNVRLIVGTESSIPYSNYDVIITNFFLDVFQPERLSMVMEKLSVCLNPNGIWICTEFQNTDKRYHSFLLKLMHWFFRAFTGLEARKLQDFSAEFNRLEYKEISKEEFYNGFIFSAIYSSI